MAEKKTIFEQAKETAAQEASKAFQKAKDLSQENKKAQIEAQKKNISKVAGYEAAQKAALAQSMSEMGLSEQQIAGGFAKLNAQNINVVGEMYNEIAQINAAGDEQLLMLEMQESEYARVVAEKETADLTFQEDYISAQINAFGDAALDPANPLSKMNAAEKEDYIRTTLADNRYVNQDAIERIVQQALKKRSTALSESEIKEINKAQKKANKENKNKDK